MTETQMTPRLLVIVPTRGRPDNAARLAEQATRMGSGKHDLLFCVDSDDESGYENSVAEDLLMWGEPARLGPWLNRVAPAYAKHYTAIGFMGDDHLPESSGWDATVLMNLMAQGPLGMVYGNDGWQGARLPTAVFMASTLIDRLGWMVPPGLEHLYIDNAWKDIGRATRHLAYLPDLKITHLHPVVAGVEGDDWDATYKAGNSPEQYARDRSIYNDFKRNVLPVIRRDTRNG